MGEVEVGPMGGNLSSVLRRMFQYLELSLGDGFSGELVFPIPGNIQAEAG